MLFLFFNFFMRKSIQAFGDSHTILYAQSQNIAEHWLGFNTNLPVTMYRMGKEGLDLVKIPTILGNGHEKYCTESNDIVLFSYGYIDVNKRIPEQKDRCEEIIKNLVSAYVKQIQNCIIKYQIRPVVLNVPPPPHKQVSEYETNHLTLRISLTKLLNKELQAECEKFKIALFDIYSILVNPATCLMKEEWSSDGIHADSQFLHVVEIPILYFISKM